jgi:uncharacterized repeat protein (TIGR02543 family)
VDGELKGTEDSITINAADYGAGKHTLTLITSKSGVSWSKELPFTVDAGTLRRVIFKANDGTGAIYAVRTVTAGDTIGDSFPGEPSRDGYDFSGWKTQPGGGGSSFGRATPVSADATVYAQWTAKTYTVTFKSNDGTDTTWDTRTVTVPVTTITNFPDAPSRDGYDFSGWKTQSDGGGSSFDSATPVNADATVYAQWTAKTYTVTFKRNDGTDTTWDTRTVTVPATTITNFPANPSRTRYNFAGLNTRANGSGMAFGRTTPVSGDLEVYAQWVHAQFDITLGTDAGEGAFNLAAFAVSKSGGGSPVSQTIAISGSGYTNPRWFVDGDPTGTESSVTINAADYGTGGHILTLIIRKNGVSWSKEISFTVTN